MIRSLYTSISGMITQEAKQDVITNNLANISTTGFKGDNLIIKNFKDVLIENKDKMVNGENVKNQIGKLSLGSKIDDVYTDYAQGSVEETGKTTDFALRDNGFFTVNRNDGTKETKNLYTRDGHFHINNKGYLVNDNGDSVQGINLNTNKQENIYVGNGKMTLASDGKINIDGNSAYKFYISDFNDYSKLKKSGDNLYEGEGATQKGNTSVQQNALEKSNVNVINEIVNMMTVMRTFETNQKMVQSIDETLGKAVNEVGSIK